MQQRFVEPMHYIGDHRSSLQACRNLKANIKYTWRLAQNFFSPAQLK